MLSRLLSTFSSPPAPYRGKVFWAWNGKLDPKELRRQIGLMRKMGLGGFFMHSRTGLASRYLSDQWFKCVRASVGQAKKLGLEAWIYDEDRWPSGSAGGLATRNPAYRMRYVTMEQFKGASNFRWRAGAIAAFTAKVQGVRCSNVKRIAKGHRPTVGAGESILVFAVKLSPASDWYNGYSYLDTLNHRAVREFIGITHSEYRKRLGRYFSNVIPGVFTDEPSHGGKFEQHTDMSADNGLPWTDSLPGVFQKKYGYDILDHLPGLFLDIDGQGVTPARHDYHDCTTFLFADAFARQISQWCHKNKLLLTGHPLQEQLLSTQGSVVGSCMRVYEFMQAPGIDVLTEHTREFDTAKQASSAARQFGRKWRLTETYGCTGWDFPFVGHKAVGDWQIAMGMNIRCQHLAWYTMQGQAKRDYPASIFYQSPWWQYYRKVEDYFARIHTVMTRGQEVRDLLVIHPVESMWMLCRKGWLRDSKVKRYDRMLGKIRDTLLGANIDFDYGDEDILGRLGRIRQSGDKPRLIVGKAKYNAVLVPPMITMRSTTLRLLRRFKAAGGTVVFAGTAVKYVDAVESPAVGEFAKLCRQIPANGKQLARAVEATCRRIDILDARGGQVAPILHLLREDKNSLYLFVCNFGYDFTKTAKDMPVRGRRLSFKDVRIRGFSGCRGRPIELDPDSGQAARATARRHGDGWEIRTSLAVVESRLFVIPKARSGDALPKQRILKTAGKRQLNPPKWDIELSEPNVLVLDRPAYRIGSGRWTQGKDVLLVDSKVRDNLGLAARSGVMKQPWAQKRSVNRKSIPVELKYTFNIRSMPAAPVFLAMECPELYEITINTRPMCSVCRSGWWTDKSLRKLRIPPAALRNGQNEIIVRCDYDARHPGFEMMYLLGAFGTVLRNGQISITPAPSSLRLGDWVKQGLTFYSGAVAYKNTISARIRRSQRLFVRVPEYAGTVVRILVNGQEEGLIGWEPNEVDITDFAGVKRIDLAIEVISSRRNSHGPLHWREKWPIWTGPECFTPSGPDRTSSYNLVPCGLMAPPELIVKE